MEGMRARIMLRNILRSNEGRRSVSRIPCHKYSNRRHLTTVGAGEKLRVAIVGGGCAGMSSALHLAPLVESGCLASPIDVYDVAKLKREIGVGIWSPGIDPFRKSMRTSHQLVYNEMTKQGTWLGDVGYRTPDGGWLMKSHLPVSDEEREHTAMPALLFLREKDMLTALEKALHWEQHQGNIVMHRDGTKTQIAGLQEDSSQPYSTRLLFQNDMLSERDYHLIIVAAGPFSVLRAQYGGFNVATGGLTVGSLSLPSPNDLPVSTQSQWPASQQQEAVGLQDRKYTVLRGNAPLSTSALGIADSPSFQTWGEGRSMRFATVPMRYPGPKQSTEERQVWFITIDDDRIASEPDPSRRRSMLLDDFKDWHDPICRMVEATPPEEILMERAIAHRHSMPPILAFNKVIERKTGRRPPNSGEGPALLFLGDAYMTVDPILAQGFTMAMQGAADLVHSVEESCQLSAKDPSLAFDPYKLRAALQRRADERIENLICMLRVTELVQALAQPQSGSLMGMLNTKLLRPLTKLTPNFIKAPVFNSVLKYSLGLHLKSHSKQ